jgi:general secretion pathway protein F
MADEQTFRYRALDSTGAERREVIAAQSEAAAARALLEMGLTPLELTPLQTRGRTLRRKGNIKLADRIVLLRELSTLLKAGISVNEALPSLESAYREQALGLPLARLTQDVRAGRPLAQAIADCGLGLPDYARAMLEAGDAGGKVAQACADAAAQMEHEQRIASELRAALTYPLILVSAGTLAVLIIFIGVVPRFASILRNPRAEVPLLSRWIIEAGVFLQQHWLNFGLVVLAALLLLLALLRNPQVRARFKEWMARLPLLGPWLIETETGRWASLLGSLLSNRVPIVPALRLSASVLGLGRLRAVLGQATTEIERGKMLSEVLARESWFPATRLNLIRVGERSGELPRMLLTLGEIQTESSRQLQKRVLSLIEPLAILLIGAVIGVIMVAVMMAITSLNTMAA